MSTPYSSSPRGTARGRGAFTLIELLVVVAIISLLIGILIPALGAARTQAKNLKSRATLKALGSGLEIFKSENEKDPAIRQTGGYPASTARDDPTREDEQLIFGAQWMIRYLVGRDLKGYAPRDNVPRDILSEGTEHWEQKQWYDDQDDEGTYISGVDRNGPYIPLDGLTLRAPEKVPGYVSGFNGPGGELDDGTYKQLVALDAFNFPVLYYAANQRHARKADANLASFEETNNGIYTMKDNALFTGLCLTSCQYPPWDFGGLLYGGADDQGLYVLGHFGETTPADLQSIQDDLDAEPPVDNTFPHYILNRSAYESSGERAAIPVKKESYILITAGKDGIYGTSDDVTNFD
jgi:prepilin-type N-terminal cleavage/methylation domain-containing protein